MPDAEPGGTSGRVLAELQARPGATVAELARWVAVDHSTATYHLRRLERRGQAVCLRHGGRLHWFLNGQATPRERAVAVGRRLAASQEVLARLSTERPARLGDVAHGLAMTRAGVLWHLARLAELGLVVAEGPPRARRYRAAVPDALPAPALAPALAAPPAAV